jgi:phenylpropionate dioxygenase-like ring-hydroxylating dioxygenase large terminal subunit
VSLVDDVLYDAPGFAVLGASSIAALYTDATVLATERAHVFAGAWALVATAEELEASGSYVTASAGGIPLAVVRGEDGQLRAFHNVCRHRGITLLEGAGAVGRHMTCPYHQWSYATTGALARVPQEDDQFGAVDRGALGLAPAQVAAWGGMVFANPSPEAPGLPETMAGLDARLDGFLTGPRPATGSCWWRTTSTCTTSGTCTPGRWPPTTTASSAGSHWATTGGAWSR